MASNPFKLGNTFKPQSLKSAGISEFEYIEIIEALLSLEYSLIFNMTFSSNNSQVTILLTLNLSKIIGIKSIS